NPFHRRNNMKIPRVQMSLLLLGLSVLGSKCPGQTPSVSDPVVHLSKEYSGKSHPSVIYRSYGETNYLEYDPFQVQSFTPCTPTPTCPTGTPGIYGDRLGYDSCGLLDVDGDGFNDWVETWYFAEPKRPGTSGPLRVGSAANTVILPPFYTPDEAP